MICYYFENKKVGDFFVYGIFYLMVDKLIIGWYLEFDKKFGDLDV